MERGRVVLKCIVPDFWLWKRDFDLYSFYFRKLASLQPFSLNLMYKSNSPYPVVLVSVIWRKKLVRLNKDTNDTYR